MDKIINEFLEAREKYIMLTTRLGRRLGGYSQPYIAHDKGRYFAMVFRSYETAVNFVEKYEYDTIDGLAAIAKFSSDQEMLASLFGLMNNGVRYLAVVDTVEQGTYMDSLSAIQKTNLPLSMKINSRQLIWMKIENYPTLQR